VVYKPVVIDRIARELDITARCNDVMAVDSSVGGLSGSSSSSSLLYSCCILGKN